MATRLLPLFPLSVVLLPATPLPLHIFEERYKTDDGELIPETGEFGVVLAKDDGIVKSVAPPPSIAFCESTRTADWTSLLSGSAASVS